MFFSKLQAFLSDKNSNDENFVACDRVIIINNAIIPNGYREIWYHNNLKYLRPLADPSNPTDPTVNPQYIFDVDKFLELKSDYEHQCLAQWLDDNDAFISFTDLYRTIDCVHVMNEIRDRTMTLSQPVIATIAYGIFFSDIMTKKQLLEGNQNIDYKCFVDLDLDPIAKTVNSKVGYSYSSVGNYFSIPFIKSLEVNHPVISTTLLSFREVTLFGIKSIVITFTDNIGTDHFYDFSQNPLRGQPILTKNLFSPL